MKKYLSIILILIIGLCIIIPNKVYAQNGYTITAYDIDMTVNEDNTFDIIETITANFTQAKHGIYRSIPLKNTLTRTDGTKSSNRATITNLNVSEKYSVSNENGYKVIKIGDSNKTITGSHVYTIEYTYDIGKDPLKDCDELYFNLIGNKWDTTISNLTFTITMPKEFDQSLLGFSSGKEGSTDSSNVTYEVNGNEITGSIINPLAAGNCLTVRLSLPEGYFTRKLPNIDVYSLTVIIICIASIGVALLIWLKYGKDDDVIQTVEFYPPEGYNSAEIGTLYKGKADDKSVISLLIYLADKGYIKIEETFTKKGKKEKSDFKIIKLKDYDGENEIEKKFFEGLFRSAKKITYSDFLQAKELVAQAKEHGDKLDLNEALNLVSDVNPENKLQEVTQFDLYNSFYKTVESINKILNSSKVKNAVFEKNSNSKIKWIIMLIVLILILTIIIPVTMDMGFGAAIIVVVQVGFFIAMTMPLFMAKSTTATILGIIMAIIMGSTFFPFIWPIISQTTSYLTLITGIISIIILIIFANIMPKRTKYGNEMLGKIEGFKNFLETAQKDQLESLVEKEPMYFYNILPYTYALGVSDKWVKKFETIAMQEPNWYNSPNGFSYNSFEIFMGSTMNSLSNAMTSSPSESSSGGGSSGGGFSGGGSGGGGGGSW